MSMRYIIRRKTPSDLADLLEAFPSLMKTLGDPHSGMERILKTPFSAKQSLTYLFLTRKDSSGSWSWTCPTIELIGENQAELLDLAKKLGLPRNQLSHLPEPATS